eukprot:COSAG02_NODE_10778_length_1859_cov_19.005114_2_plen_95_part_00
MARTTLRRMARVELKLVREKANFDKFDGLFRLDSLQPVFHTSSHILGLLISSIVRLFSTLPAKPIQRCSAQQCPGFDRSCGWIRRFLMMNSVRN